METTKGHCIFTIEGAERQDEGIYSVVVRNPAGEDTADINVKVVGKTELTVRLTNNNIDITKLITTDIESTNFF